MKKISLMLVLFVISILITGSLNAEMCQSAVAVSGGEDHTMVLMEDGTLWACGDNSDKQLGVTGDRKSVV